MISDSPLLIAQVTDMHLFAHEQQELLGLPTDQLFQAVLQRLSHPGEASRVFTSARFGGLRLLGNRSGR